VLALWQELLTLVYRLEETWSCNGIGIRTGRT
jgi:hypothetical protein